MRWNTPSAGLVLFLFERSGRMGKVVIWFVIIMITDKNGLKHIYEVTETEVVNPYDNSIKTQGDKKELTLFTCSQKGTMRFVVSCIYKEEVMDE